MDPERLLPELKALLAEQLPFRILVEKELEVLLNACEVRSFAFGDLIFGEGDPGDALYIIYSGRVRIFKLVGGRQSTLVTLGRGEMFGEYALLTESLRSASARASQDTVLVRIGRDQFQVILERHPELVAHLSHLLGDLTLRTFLRKTGLGTLLPPDGLRRLARSIETCAFLANEVIFRAGSPRDCVYIVRSGEIKVVREESDGVPDPVHIGPGEFFGEWSLLSDQPRSRTAIACEATECYSLARTDFLELIEQFPKLESELRKRMVVAQRHEQIRLRLAGDTDVKQREVEVPSTAAEAVSCTPTTARTDTADLPGDLRTRSPRRALVFQNDETDCGAACLATAARYYGYDFGLEVLREEANVGRDGASLLGLTRAAEQLGFHAVAVRVESSRIDEVRLPAILHWHDRHFVVLFRVEQQHFVVGDPAEGIGEWNRDAIDNLAPLSLLQLSPTKRLEEQTQLRSVRRRLVGQLQSYSWPVMAFLGATLLINLLEVVLVAYVGAAFDLLSQADRQPQWWLWGVAGVSLIGVGSTISYASKRHLLNLSDSLSLHFTADLLGHILRLPMRFYRTRTHDSVMRVLEDGDELRGSLTTTLASTCSAVVGVILLACLIGAYSGQLAVIVTCSIAVSGFACGRITQRARAHERRFRANAALSSLRREEVIQSIERIKGASAESAIDDELRTLFKREQQDRTAVEDSLATQTILLRTVWLATLAIVVCATAIMVADSRMSMGGSLACVLAVCMLSRSVQSFSRGWNRLTRLYFSLFRVTEILETPTEAELQRGHEALPTNGELRCVNVSFRYQPDQSFALRDVSLTIPPGTTTILVGRPRSGRTALFELLQRFEQPTDGSILVDGTPLCDIELASWRNQTGVLTETFDGTTCTIRDRIRLGVQEIPHARVEFAAETAGLHAYVTSLPDGYDTVIGNLGMQLSDRWLCRIELARAIVNNPRLLLIDERCCGLDSESEITFRQSLELILRGRTSLVISDRPWLLRDADRILVFDQGRIIEQGSHAELLSRQGLYYYLYDRRHEFQ